MDTDLVLSPPRPHVVQRLLATARLCVVEARPSVLFVFLLRFLAGSALGGIDLTRESIARIGGTALVWELAVFAVYLFNGVTDVHEDRINGSRRPIARGALPTQVALWVATSAAIVSIGGALALGAVILWAVLALLGLGYCYSSPHIQFKRHVATSVFTGISLGLLTYYAGHIANAGGHWSYPGPELALFMAGVTAWMGFVGGLTKDLSDVAGDAAAGRRTVPGVCGERRARYAAVAAALVLASAFLAAGALTSPLLLWPGVAMLLGAMAMAAVCLGGFAGGTRKNSRAPYRVFMTTQYLMNLSLIPPLAVALLSS